MINVTQVRICTWHEFLCFKCNVSIPTCSVRTVPTGLVMAISFVADVTTRSRASRSGRQPRAASSWKGSTWAPALIAQTHT